VERLVVDSQSEYIRVKELTTLPQLSGAELYDKEESILTPSTSRSRFPARSAARYG
jgi:hypothetical protein